MIPSRSRGVSLIEALVAMAAMAFGMLGVVGLQSTLRMNADVAKQRSEAVRIGQEIIESSRQFSTIPVTGGRRAFDDIVDQSGGSDKPGTNATFRHFETVADGPGGAPYKSLKVRVAWNDRVGQPQDISLVTNIARVSPELSGALSITGSGSLSDNPGGRNLAVPRSAIDIPGTGNSEFAPPGAPVGSSWIFNNTTGFITSQCTLLGGCIAVSARLLTGFIQFATGSAQPTSIESESPSSISVSGAGLSVTTTAPAVAGPLACFTDAPLGGTYVQYFCAVDIGVAGAWSGTSAVTGIPIASVLTETSSLLYRVCRYTPLDTVTAKNEDHPLNYTDVATSLINQNFLVIRAGSGTMAFSCTDDNPSTTVNGNTYQHQPAS